MFRANERSDSQDWFRISSAEIWQKEGTVSPPESSQLSTLFLQIYRDISPQWWLWIFYSEFAIPKFEDWTSMYCLESRQWRGVVGLSCNQNCRYGATRILPRILSSKSYNLWRSLFQPFSINNFVLELKQIYLKYLPIVGCRNIESRRIQRDRPLIFLILQNLIKVYIRNYLP